MHTLKRTAHWMLVAASIATGLLFWPQTLGGRMTYVRVDGHSMDPTFHMGDLAIVRKQSSYAVGDPVAYRIPKGEFGAGAIVIHRLIGGDGAHGYVTKGDNRTVVDEWHPHTGDVVGRVRYAVPGAGTTFARLSQPVYLGVLVSGLTVFTMLLPSKDRRMRKPRGRHVATAPIGLAR